MMYEYTDLGFEKYTVRIDFAEYISYAEFDRLALQLITEHRVSIDTNGCFFESPRVLRATATVLRETPDYVVRNMRRKFHIYWRGQLFCFEHILDIRYTSDRRFEFGPIGA